MIVQDPMVLILVDAIENQNTVVIDYDDKERDVEPHAVGVNAKGEYVLRCWQTETIDDSKEGWKLMKVDKMHRIINRHEDVFAGPRPAYVAEDSAMVEVLACL